MIKKLIQTRYYLLLTVMLFGCTATRVEPPEFDGDRAFGYLQMQVDFGPRVPGSPAAIACRSAMVEHLLPLASAVDSQTFDFADPYSGQTIPMVNLIASFDATDTEADRILLLAHYDSRPRCDFASADSLMELPLNGANDGASGVAVLMELANAMNEQRPSCSVDLVFVDGEDWGKRGDNHLYLLGSQEFARHSIRSRYRFGIVVDMIGDMDQQVYREVYSDSFNLALNDMVFQTAQRLGVETFHDSVKYTILDDHMPLSAGGVPSVLLIDFDYIYWHTELDSTDQCSATSLQNVGRVVSEIIYNPALWPDK